MPNDTTNFSQDLDTPGAGTDSELYRAISPLIDLNGLPEPKTDFDRQRIEKLKDDLRRGTVGLEYLTGLKNNKVETFYDRHPVQAAISNALNNSGTAGASVALGIPTLNFLRQSKMMNKTVPSLSTREGDPNQRAAVTRLNPKKDGVPVATDPDTARVFGSGSVENPSVTQVGQDGKPRTYFSEGITNERDIRRRAAALDMASKQPSEISHSARLENILQNPELSPGEKSLEVKKLLQDWEKGPAAKNLGHFSELQKILEEKGKVLRKAPIGSGIGDKILASDRFQNLLANEKGLGLSHYDRSDIKKLLKTKGRKGTELRIALQKKLNALKSWGQGALVSSIPNSFQQASDLADSQVGRGANPYLLNEVLSDHFDQELAGNPVKRKALDTMLLHRNNPGFRSVPSNILRRYGLPAAAGLGIYGVGKGLHSLVSGLQNQVYGDEQINEWKRNNLKSQGEFEEANRIK